MTTKTSMMGLEDVSLFDDSDGEMGKRKKPKETHPDEADRLVQPNLVKQRPGKVFTEGRITLHTNMGHRMFYGRRETKVRGKTKPGIVGLVRFIQNMNQMCDLAKAGDPYADHWLIEMETLLLQTREDLAEFKQYLVDLLQTGGSSSRVSVYSGISESPVTLPLKYKYPQYGYQAAELVGLYDEVVQLALNAKDAAWLSPVDFKRLVTNAGKAVRHCFYMSTQYKYSGATRDDYAANNQRARSALERMGYEVPADVMNGTRLPKWLRHDVTSGSSEESAAMLSDEPETGTDELLGD